MRVSRWAGPKRKNWTVDEFHELADLGAFREQRVELIEGDIVQMPPMKPPHTAGVDLGRVALEQVFAKGYWVRAQFPLRLGPRSEPQPDLAVVVGSRRTVTTTPTTAVLVVEVSDATLSYDRRRKGSLYARAGIADYWIVNLNRGRLEVYRQPQPDPSRRYGYGYTSVALFGPADFVAPLAMPNATVAVADMLP